MQYVSSKIRKHSATARFLVLLFACLLIVFPSVLVARPMDRFPLPIPTLGTYPNTSIVAGGNAVITPSAAPGGNTIGAVAFTQTRFTGILTVDPVSGVIRVTDAKQAGVYLVTVRAFDGSGLSTTTSFTLTVTNAVCSGGTFGGAVNYSAGLGPHAVAIGDFNGDRKQDAVIANFDSHDVSVLIGDGTGAFTNTATIGCGTYPSGIVLGDFNSDGKQDFAATNYTSNNVTIGLGNGTGGFSVSGTVSVENGPLGTVVGEFNGDGKQDLATVNRSSGTVSIRLGDGVGGFSGILNLSIGYGCSALCVGEFNGDGFQDLAITNDNLGNVAIRLGDGTGNFSGSTAVSVGAGPYSIATGDFNADGKQDLATANYTFDHVAIRLGDGLGGFSGTTLIPVGPDPTCVAIGDFNGDGYDDFATSCYGGQSLSVRFGNGAAGFSGTGAYPINAGPYGLAVGDFNADGIEDLATANSYSSSMGILLGVANEINLKGNNVTITDGDLIPTTADHSDFGSTLVCSGTISRTFTIENLGNTTLNITGVTITGSAASNFTVSVAPASTVSAGGQTTFQVVFDPSAIGMRQATIHIANDDCDENPYDFAIQGTGNADIVNPSITCPANVNTTTSSDGGNNCAAVVTGLGGSASDNCTFVVSYAYSGATTGSGSATVNQMLGTFAMGAISFSSGVTTVNCTAMDASGNTSTCSFTVTVFDNEVPTALCRNLTVYLNSGGTANLVPAMLDNGSTDNCAVTSRSLSNTSLTCANLGANAVTLTVSDASGNSSTCAGTVTIADSTHPTALCRNLTVYLNSGDTANLVPAMLDNGSTDNCAIATRSLSSTSLTCANLGANAITLTVSDASGNTATCSGTVTIADSTHPNAICRHLTIYLNSGGTANLVPAMLDNGSTDNCGITSRSINITTVNCSNLGTNNVTLTVNDASSNGSTCVGTVTVRDSIHPTAICQSAQIQIPLDANGQATILPSLVDNGSSDICGISNLIVSPNTFTCASQGYPTTTLTVTDNDGNTSTCTSNAIVYDGVPPIAICRDITMFLDGSGIANIVPGMVDNGSTDECLIANRSVSPNIFNCPNVGPNNVTLTIYDTMGASDQCISLVTVVDSTHPIALCQNLSAYLDVNGTVNVPYSAVDAGSSDACGIGTLGPIAPGGYIFHCSQIGPNVVTLTVSDVNGNTSTCTSTITVLDSIHPTITCPGSISISNDPGQCYAATTFNLSITDNCPVGLSTALMLGLASGDNFPVGITNELFQVVDVSGNTDTCSFSVTIIDAESPSIICPPNMTLSAAPGLCSASALYSPPVGADNCPGAVTIRTVGIPSGGTVSAGMTQNNVFQVTDAAGNSATCSFTIAVIDTQPPTLTCPASLNVSVDANACTAVVSYFQPIRWDNCSGSTTNLVSGLPSGATFPIGTTTLSFLATDLGGNTSTCSFNVVVNDGQAPAITCPANSSVSASVGACSATVSYTTPVGTDNCGGATTTQIAGLASGVSFPVGIMTNTFRVTDGAGNSTTCAFTVTVTDGQAPAITCPANSSVSASVGACSATVSYTTPVGTDNCGGATTTQIAGLASGVSFPVGVTTNTFRVTDGAGNSTTCAFTVTVTDGQAPAITCPANSSASVGACSTTVSYTTPVGTDNCSGATTTQIAGLASGVSFPVGITTNTFRVTDGAGNSTTCAFTVTVTDGQAPTITCPANSSVSASVGACSATVSYTTPVGTDNCSGATTTQIAGLASGVSFPVGITTNTFRVTDGAGNSTTCAFTVTVTDGQAPAITCPANSSVSASVGACSATVSYTTPVGTDNCSGATTTQTAGLASGVSFPLGVTTNTFRVTDGAGNSTTCAFTVTVTDGQAPTITCPANITVGNTANVCAAIVTYTTPVGTDNCSGATTTQTAGLASGATFTTGTTTNTFRVTDGAGNSTTCAFTVTVNDTQAPTAICQSVTVQLDPNGNGSTTAAAVNSGSSDNCTVTSITLSQSAFTCANAGANIVTLTVTDGSGNTGTCTATVTVVAQPVTLIAQPAIAFCGYNITCAGATNGVAVASGSGGCPPYSYSWSTGASTSTVTGLGAGTYTVTVTDGAGGTAVESVTLTAPSAPQANAITTPTCTGESNGSIDLTVTGGNDCQGYTFDWSNNATTEDLSGLAAGTYTVTVTDVAGCTQTLTQTVVALPLPQPSFAQSGNLLTSTQTWSSYQWLFNGSNIPGANANSYLISQTGTYALSVTDSNGCVGLSDTNTVVGTSAGWENFNLSLYPNPARGTFRLRSSHPIAEDLLVTVHDMFGRQVMQRNLDGMQQEVEFNISEFAAGTYFIEVRSLEGDWGAGYKIVFRLVVQ